MTLRSSNHNKFQSANRYYSRKSFPAKKSRSLIILCGIPSMFLFELGHCETTALQEVLVELRRHLNISVMPESLLRL